MSAATFSPSTLQLFAELLGSASLNAGDPQFEAKAATVAVARRELGAALQAAQAAVPGEGSSDLGIEVAIDEPPRPNRAARRSSAKAAKRTTPKSG